MTKKNKIILSVGIGVILIGVLLGFWLASTRKEKPIDEGKQRDALTHDILTIEPYRHPYIGNASNVGNLFATLPLHHIARTFEIDSKACTLTVRYAIKVPLLGEDKVKRDLIYNTVAAMASIDNLNGITYSFEDATYNFSRKEIEDLLLTPLADLLDQQKWHDEVQSKLSSREFVSQFYQ